MGYFQVGVFVGHQGSGKKVTVKLTIFKLYILENTVENQTNSEQKGTKIEHFDSLGRTQEANLLTASYQTD